MNSGRRWHGWEIDGYPEDEPCPPGMDWDTWTGTAEMHPYSRRYNPGNWRSWYIYGNGVFGDWGPHILDTAHRFLQLGLPTEIEAVKREGPNDYNRDVFEGIAWVLRSGAWWQDLPKVYPSPSTCWRRLQEWEEQGLWLKIWRKFLSELEEQGQLEWEETFADGSFAPAKKGALHR